MYLTIVRGRAFWTIAHHLSHNHIEIFTDKCLGDPSSHSLAMNFVCSVSKSTRAILRPNLANVTAMLRPIVEPQPSR